MKITFMFPVLLVWVQVALADANLPAIRFEQSGSSPSIAEQPAAFVLANEPEGGKANLVVEFDLAAQTVTPLARLHLDNVLKLQVKRPGQKNTGERGILHVFAPGLAEPVGVLPVKAGGLTNAYMIDVTAIVNAALAQPAGRRKLQLEVRLEGKPLYYEVYAAPKNFPPTLEIVTATNWSDDWPACVAPITRGPQIYREPCLPLTDNRDKEVVLPLLYPAKKINAVVANATGAKLEEGRDWLLRDGKLVLPCGTRAPVQLEAEFFLAPHKEKNGTTNMIHTAVRLMEGTWYHERQLAVTYEPAARDWSFPPPRATLDQLPRLKQKLAAKEPLTLLLFGDSISAGGNASKFQNAWPWQPSYGELVARALGARWGSRVNYLNHSRAGATSGYGLAQADEQAAWFKPDLAIIAYGMNDRGDTRRGVYRENLEKILATIRARSPATEFIVVAPMLNNPKQPTGLDPVLFIRDEALKLAGPGIATVDVTSMHLEIIKRKPYLDLSGNGANHPNDFLHRLYAQRILEILTPPP